MKYIFLKNINIFPSCTFTKSPASCQQSTNIHLQLFIELQPFLGLGHQIFIYIVGVYEVPNCLVSPTILHTVPYLSNTHSLFGHNTLIIPPFSLEKKKGYINFVSKSVCRPSVCQSVRMSIRHVSCKCISS